MINSCLGKRQADYVINSWLIRDNSCSQRSDYTAYFNFIVKAIKSQCDLIAFTL